MTKTDAEVVIALTQCSMSIADAAKMLHYHRNTVDWHVKKIRFETGLDPRNFFDLGELRTIALEILGKDDLTNLIDCKSVRERILDDVQASDYKNLKLVIISTSDDAASKIYVENKVKTAESVGIEAQVINIANPTYKSVGYKIVEAATDESVTGIILQLPLPDHLKVYEREFLDLIPYEKDVDGLSSESMGRLWAGKPCLVPATARGVMELLPEDLSGKVVTVVNRSNLIGKPLIKLLLDRNATVNVCHSKTGNLLASVIAADIVIVGIGVPKFFGSEYFSAGQTWIDCGINRDRDGKICGDVDIDAAKKARIRATKVPGGVGLLTTAQLMRNVVQAHELQADL